MGSYDFNLKAEIEFPTDFTETELSQLESSTSINAQIKASCEYTEFDDFQLEDLSVVLFHPEQSSATLTLPAIKDLTSKTEGNQDGYSYCGDRVFDLVDETSHTNFLSLNQDS
jgi:hypothetical protein